MNSQSIVRFIKSRSLALGLALIVGVIGIAPHILAVHALGNGYQGYPFLYQANETLYIARIQDIVDGHPLVGSPMLYEYKDSTPPVLPINEYFYALPAIALHVPVMDVVVAYKFLLPALLVLLIYELMLLLLRKDTSNPTFMALCATATVILGYDLVDYAHIWALLTATQTHVLLWTRPVNPIIGELLLFTALIIVVRTLLHRSTWLFIFGGLVLGAMIAYVFSWMIGGATIVFAIFYTLIKKDYWALRRLIGMLAISFFVQIPYWYHSLTSLHGAAGHALQLKNGAYFTHVPIVNKFLLAVSLVFAAVALYGWYRKKSLNHFDFWWWFSGMVLLAGWATFSQQLLTGVTVWPYHIVQFTIPLSIIVLFLLLHHVLSTRAPRLSILISGALLLISLAIGISSVLSYQYELSDFSLKQTQMSVFSWLNQNAPTDCVVLSDEEQEDLAFSIPAFTHCKSYMTTYVNFNVPDERVMHNFLVMLRLRGIKPQAVQHYLTEHPGLVNEYLYTTIDQSLYTGLNAETTRNIAAVVPAYRAFYQNSFTDELKKYRIDYILSASSTLVEVLPESIGWHKVDLGAYHLFQVPSR